MYLLFYEKGRQNYFFEFVCVKKYYFGGNWWERKF